MNNQNKKSYLNKIYAQMKEKISNCNSDFYIPELWNAISYDKISKEHQLDKQIAVNPYDFFCAVVDDLLKEKQEGSKDETLMPLIYSVLPRSLTAWKHDGETIENGSFVKLIMILPLLKSYGVTVLYLLPICDHGKMNMKGDSGSPYAIRDFYEIDSDLHDRLLGDYSKEKLHDEFGAFVEACHKIGIKVILDFAFRTVSRDNVLVENHPDWFYWIKAEKEESFHAPSLENESKPVKVNKKNIKNLYTGKATVEYLKMFSLPPNQLDKEKWDKLLNTNENTPDNIKKIFDITTVPGFSDVVNDTQPPWSDVTYLKYYLDYPSEVEGYLEEGQPPYIMQDGVSLNLYHGNIKNEELWQYIIDVLPFYYNEYSIDGARIDMAHAMPTELNSKLIEKIRNLNPDFLLWSEEFNARLSAQSKKDGFNLISGYTYILYKKYNYSSFNSELILKNMLQSEIPIAASVETPDTPRITCILKNKELVKALYFINSFLPNAYPLLNNGNELFEIQPMNLGLDNTEEGRFVLPENDQMYGKLAFFDKYTLKWDTKDVTLIKTIDDIKKLRSCYNDLVSHKNNFVPQNNFMDNKKITPLCYFDNEKKCGIVIATNRSVKENSRINLDLLIPNELDFKESFVRYNEGEFCEKSLEGKKTIKVKPCETAVITFDC